MRCKDRHIIKNRQTFLHLFDFSVQIYTDFIVFYTISDDEREFLERFLAKWQKSVIFAPR
jgi:hypothetical protein